MVIAEPGIIETPITTILINPGDRAVMDELGNIRITVGSRATLSRGDATLSRGDATLSRRRDDGA